MHRIVTFKLLALLVLLTISSAAALWLFLEEYYTLSIIALIVLALSLGGVISFNNRNARKLMFMFSSIENGDYSFKFTESGHNRRNTLVNQSLNRIRNLLTRARDETIEQEKYFQLILESVTTGVVIINSRGNVYQTNREAIRLLGIDPFTHIRQLMRLDEQFPALMSEIEAGENRQLTCNNERGSVILSVHASSIVRRGETLKILALTDIENELSDREIESWIRLIRVLTHEIMNSINPITSISDSLVERVGDGDDKQIRHGLETISQTAKSLISFVESYRKFTRLPSPDPTLFYLREFMESLRELALATVSEDRRNQVRIILSLEPEDLILYADRGLVSQVAINLLKNAIEATLQTTEPCIEFAATVDSREEVILSVTDNGPGIPPEVAEHIFIPFFTTKTGGSGVGLSLSRQIMRLHGGTLKYRPGAESRGSVFTMTFR